MFVCECVNPETEMYEAVQKFCCLFGLLAQDKVRLVIPLCPFLSNVCSYTKPVSIPFESDLLRLWLSPSPTI